MLQKTAGDRGLSDPGTYRALVIACLLQLYQQLSGANMTLYFSATLIEKVASASPVWTAWYVPALLLSAHHIELARTRARRALMTYYTTDL